MKSKFGYQKESKSQQMQRQIKSESKSHSKKKTVKQTPAMTPKAKLTPIKDISPMVTNMRIRGRVISKWHAHKLNQAHDPYSLELVLQDEEGDRIQWTRQNGYMDQIDDNLIGFRNEPFTRILDTNVEYEENNYVDVIGTVVGIGDGVAVNSIGACKIRRTIVIEDEEGERLELTFWDSWANKWNEYAEKLDIVGHIDVMLMLGKMYINKSILELLSFRHRYEGREEYDANEHKIQLVSHETKIVTPQEFMHGVVKQLVGSIRETEPETECVIYATIHSIQYESGWTYIGCKICSKKVVPLASKGPSSSKTKQTWWCEKHESQDQVASRMYKMSGYTAWKLVKKHGTDTATYFPDELNCIIGKKFLFRVKFTEYNHKNNSHVYKCKRVTNDEEIITYWKQVFFEDEESEEDSEDDLITPTVPIKTKKVLDLSLTRRLQLTSLSTCDIGSSSGQSSGSGKKRSRIIDRSIVVIDLS
ncbi:replication protein A 70 kDa DNA-binding subunit B, partial [Tanacetum coccineum]